MAQSFVGPRDAILVFFFLGLLCQEPCVAGESHAAGTPFARGDRTPSRGVSSACVPEEFRVRTTLLPNGAIVSLGAVPPGERLRFTDFTSRALELGATRFSLEVLVDGSPIASIPTEAISVTAISSWAFNAHLKRGIVASEGEVVSMRLIRHSGTGNNPISLNISGVREPMRDDLVQIRTLLEGGAPATPLYTVPEGEVLVLRDFVSEIIDGQLAWVHLSVFADGVPVAQVPSRFETPEGGLGIRSWSFLSGYEEGIVIHSGQELSVSLSIDVHGSGRILPVTLVGDRRAPKDAPWNLLSTVPIADDPVLIAIVPPDKDLLLTDVTSRVRIGAEQLDLFVDGEELDTIPARGYSNLSTQSWAFDSHLTAPVLIPRGSRLSARLGRPFPTPESRSLTLVGRFVGDPVSVISHRTPLIADDPPLPIVALASGERFRLQSILSPAQIWKGGGGRFTLELFADGLPIADIPSQLIGVSSAHSWSFQSQFRAGVSLRGPSVISAQLTTWRSGSGRQIEISLRGSAQEPGRKVVSKKRNLRVGADPEILGTVPTGRRFLITDLSSRTLVQEANSRLTFQVLADGSIVGEVASVPNDAFQNSPTAQWPWSFDTHFETGIPLFAGEEVSVRLIGEEGLGDVIPLTFAGILLRE